MTQEQIDTTAPRTDGMVIHWAGFYDSVLRIISLGREQELRRQTVAVADLQPGQHVLDVGCGTGTLTIAAAQAAADIEVYGIDPSSEMIERARGKAAEAGVVGTFDTGIIEKLDFEDDTFDVVLSSLMLHHLPAPTRFNGFLEILRVLKPGGRFVAVDFPGPGSTLHHLGLLLTGGRSPRKRHVDLVIEQVKGVGFEDLQRGHLAAGLLFSLVAHKPA